MLQALFTRPPQQQFELFVAFAILESHRDIILRYLMEVGCLCGV